jgi:NADH-quinone oxidoreductase subunit M
MGTLVVLCLALGLWPQPVIDTMKPDVRVLAEIGDSARARIRGVPYVSKEPSEPAQTVTIPPAPQEPKGGQPKGGQKGKGGAPKGKGGKAKGKGPNPKGGVKGPQGLTAEEE